MKLNYETIMRVTKEYGDAFYVLDTEQFIKNYNRLLRSFRRYYENTHIAYSYKTNYIPDLCQIINKHGGFAEIVSEMEYELAKKIGVDDTNIYYNGPYKSFESIESLLINDGNLNIDSFYELELIKQVSQIHPDKTLRIGIRCNIEIDNEVLSRFGFDVESPEFDELLTELNQIDNVKIIGLHLHIATRSLITWEARVSKMIEFIKRRFDPSKLDYVSLGGGLFGNMHESLKKQFSDFIPSFDDYAAIAAKEFSSFAHEYNVQNVLKLLIEPGSALVGDAMKFVSRVINIKNIRGKYIATLAGSIYNINPTLNKKNPPIEIIHSNEFTLREFENLDFGGFTCIESDYLYRGYSGKIEVNDFVVFSNVGSYSVVLKPPFILPNFGIVKFKGIKYYEVKRKETFQDIFLSYKEIEK